MNNKLDITEEISNLTNIFLDATDIKLTEKQQELLITFITYIVTETAALTFSKFNNEDNR